MGNGAHEGQMWALWCVWIHCFFIAKLDDTRHSFFAKGKPPVSCFSALPLKTWHFPCPFLQLHPNADSAVLKFHLWQEEGWVSGKICCCRLKFLAIHGHSKFRNPERLSVCHRFAVVFVDYVHLKYILCVARNFSGVFLCFGKGAKERRNSSGASAPSSSSKHTSLASPPLLFLSIPSYNLFVWKHSFQGIIRCCLY